ncbi:MAG: polynucleotide adenylyltransferase PcnB [Algicola sp.]|nr:polynucleotide adenylyltransferase PcnB [Algicola sp.]
MPPTGDTVIITKVVNFYRKLIKNVDQGPAVDSVSGSSTSATEGATKSAAKKTSNRPSAGEANSQSAIEKSRDKCKNFTNAIPRDQHNISRKQLSPNALKVLYRLQDNGYEAYLVGGCIRDILLGKTPKDFDVVTNATPEQVKASFNNCRLIGRRFRLAHIMYGREIIEVATMRGHHDQPPEEANNKNNTSHHSDEGQLLRDNVYGSIEEDAQRRDFTINALYYSVNGFYVRDFANGIAAIEAKRIELIGDPEARYREDPVRMLRAVRFATKLDMTIEEKTEQPLYELGSLLTNIPSARLFEESMKLTLAGKAEANYRLMRKYGLFGHMFPVPSEILNGDMQSKQERLVQQMFVNTDIRINNRKRVTPAYIHAALLWYVVEQETDRLMQEQKLSHYDASYNAMTEVLARHCRSIALPKRFSTVSRDIWQLQSRLTRRMGKRAFKLLEHPKFRAGYDFLLLRGEIEGGEVAELGQWWTDFQHADEKTRQTMANAIGSDGNIRAHSGANSSDKSTTKSPARKRTRKPSNRNRKPASASSPASAPDSAVGNTSENQSGPAE